MPYVAPAIPRFWVDGRLHTHQQAAQDVQGLHVLGGTVLLRAANWNARCIVCRAYGIGT